MWSFECKNKKWNSCDFSWWSKFRVRGTLGAAGWCLGNGGSAGLGVGIKLKTNLK